MKTISLLASLLLSFTVLAQSFQEALATSGGEAPFATLNGTSLSDYNSLTGNPLEFSKMMGVFYEFDDIRFAKVGTDGSYLLFEDWNTFGTINVGNRSYQVSNVNFHIEREELMSKIDNDSLFLFDLNSLDSFSINNKLFKNIQNKKDGIFRVYEVLFQSPSISLLKKYSADMMEASPNPMLHRSRNKIIHRENYFVMKNNQIVSFSLNKSSYLNLVADANEKPVKNFVKESKLSFSRESDAGRILHFMQSLEN